MHLPKCGLGNTSSNIILFLPFLLMRASRDHDELRHSLRSVLQYFRESTKKFIILTSDFEFPVSYSPFKYLLGLEKRSYETRGATHAGFAARRRNIESEEDYEDEDEPYATARLGLLPQWLVFDLPEEQVPGQPPVPAKQTIGQWKDGDISLEVVHHAEVFDQYEGTVFNRFVPVHPGSSLFLTEPAAIQLNLN